MYDDLQYIEEPGHPELPFKYIHLIIPPDQKVKDIHITVKDKKIISIDNPVFPVQPDIPTSINYQKPEFSSPNVQIYNSDDPYPSETVRVVRHGYFDGNNHIVTIAVYPLQYLPKSKQLLIYSNMGMTLEMEETSRPNIHVRKRQANNQLLYDNILNTMVDNPNDISSYQIIPMIDNSFEKLNSSPGNYEYVIITSNALKNSFNKFIEWKKRKGIDIGIITVEEILSNYTGDLISGIYDDAGKVRQYLFDAYQAGTVWALLGGDYTVVPIRYCAGSLNPTSGYYIIPADLYFADFNGDWNVDGDEHYGEPYHSTLGDNPDYHPEIFVGRLLCSSIQDVLNWTEKIIQYEQNPGNGDVTYLTRSFMVGADEVRDQMDHVSPRLPSSYNHTKWKELPSGSSGNPTFPLGAQVVEEMNNNYGLHSWFMHGAPFAAICMSRGYNLTPRWGVNVVEDYEGNHVSEINNHLGALSNKNYPSVLYSIDCTQTPFDDYSHLPEERNLGEGFTVMYESGGPAFLGNTRYGWVGTSYRPYQQFADLIKLATYHPESGKSYLHLGVADVHINVRSIDNGMSYDVTASDVSSYTFNTTIRPLIITITNRNVNGYLPYTAITGGNINTNVSFWGKFVVLGNLTVANNKTLTIEPGTHLSFKSNASLIVNGKLIAYGTQSSTITFTSFDQYWRGITLSGSGAANSLLEYVTIEKVQTYGGSALSIVGANGVSIRYSNIIDNVNYGTNGIGVFDVSGSPGVDIYHNTISNNGGYGVRFGNSAGNIYANTIENNPSGGVYCGNYSSPMFGKWGFYWQHGNGNNTITGGAYGIRAYNRSHPYIGSMNNSSVGFNRVFNTTTARVHVQSYSNPIAEKNWWGSSSPNPAWFVVADQSSSIDWTPYLTSDPGPALKMEILDDQEHYVVLSLNLENEDKETVDLRTAIEKRHSREYDASYLILRRLFDSVKDDHYREMIYVELFNLFREYSIDDITLFINEYRNSRNSSDHALDLLYAKVLRLMGNQDEAVELLESVARSYQRSEYEKIALIEQFFILYSSPQEESTLSNIMSALNSIYHDDPLISDLNWLMVLKNGMEYFVVDDDLNVVTEDMTSELSLINYPNPFNPATVIQYTIPRDGHVKLSVYDILGSRVEMLIDEYHEAGNYSAVFNSIYLSSGLYFARLEYRGEFIARRLMLVK